MLLQKQFIGDWRIFGMILDLCTSFHIGEQKIRMFRKPFRSFQKNLDLKNTKLIPRPLYKSHQWHFNNWWWFLSVNDYRFFFEVLFAFVCRNLPEVHKLLTNEWGYLFTKRAHESHNLLGNIISSDFQEYYCVMDNRFMKPLAIF